MLDDLPASLLSSSQNSMKELLTTDYKCKISPLRKFCLLNLDVMLCYY